MFIKDLVMWRHYNVILENSDITSFTTLSAKISDNWNHLMRLRDMKHLRIECILLKFHWGMKALTEVHFQM
jgi:hypothetical protein